MNRPEPIELENNLGPDAVTGEINRVPWMAYDIDEVDAILAEKDKEIAELKSDNEKLKKQSDDFFTQGMQMAFDLTGEKLRHRTTSRALWLARAYRAGHCASVFYFVPSEYLNTPLNIYGYANKDIGMERMLKPRRWMKIWQKVERLCRAKAEEYK